MNMRNLLLAILLLGTTGVFAQNAVIDEELIPENRQDQHEEFLADKTPYPAKPRNMWAVGLHVGIPNISGDVKTRPFGGVGGTALGYGVNVRKAIGYATSLRLGYLGGTAYGQNWDRQAVGNNSALIGAGYSNPRPGDTAAFSDYVHNYQNKYHDIALDVVLNLNNLKFHKGENNVAFFLAGGVGAMIYQTNYDAIGSGGPYDYSNILNLDREDLKAQRDDIEAMLDGDFETAGELDPDKAKLGDNNALRFRAGVGGGVQFKLGNRLSLDLEHRAILTFDDLLDGQQWESPFTKTPDKDVLHYTSVGVSIHIGKNATDPSWFENPMSYVYSELKEIQPPDMTDSDGDGVIDILDAEPETPEGYPVTAKGVTLDSDKDGCPDGEDPEPFSAPGFPIVDCKNVMPNLLDAEEIEALIDNKLEPILGGAGSNWFLPSIQFNLNSSSVRADAYDELAYVADVMNKYPNLKVEVIGHTDTRASEEYNSDLSRKRAEAAIAHLVENYEIAEGRFVLKYEGEADVLYNSARTEAQHQMNRRVEFQAVRATN